jgi:hypothetical protein
LLEGDKLQQVVEEMIMTKEDGKMKCSDILLIVVDCREINYKEEGEGC